MTKIIPVDPAQNIYSNDLGFKLVAKQEVPFEGRTVQKLTYRDSHSSRGMTVDEQKTLIKNLNPLVEHCVPNDDYHIPHVLDVLAFVDSGNQLLPGYLVTCPQFTRTQELTNNKDHLVVGCYDDDGLNLSINKTNNNKKEIGVMALRKF